jgi:hypothetical protein
VRRVSKDEVADARAALMVRDGARLIQRAIAMRISKGARLLTMRADHERGEY